DEPELLLARERLLAVGVPALVELALVLVGPLPGDVVRSVAAAGRVVHHPRLLRIRRAHGVQPLDRLVGEGVREVVLTVLALGDSDGRVVLRYDRVVLAGGARQEPVPVVEAPRQRPVVEGAGRADLAPRRQVPLAEAGSDVTVLPEHAGQGGAASRSRSRVP